MCHSIYDFYKLFYITSGRKGEFLLKKRTKPSFEFSFTVVLFSILYLRFRLSGREDLTESDVCALFLCRLPTYFINKT